MTTTNEFAPSVKMHHATRAKAMRLSVALQAEYPRLTLIATEGDAIDHEVYEVELAGFEVLVDEDEAIWTGDKLPELADILDACQEAEIDPTTADEEEDDEEERAGGSVVASTYRNIYALASSNGQGNGDWLHEFLVSFCAGDNGFQIGVFQEVLRANHIEPETTKWGRNTTGNGWQGRYRMSGRLALEKAIAMTGVFHIPGCTDATGDDFDAFLSAMTTKHAKAIEKAAKAAAKALGAAKTEA